MGSIPTSVAFSKAPIASCYLKAATIYLIEERLESGRGLRVVFALDTLGPDPPHLAECNVPLREEVQIKSLLDSPHSGSSQNRRFLMRIHSEPCSIWFSAQSFMRRAPGWRLKSGKVPALAPGRQQAWRR